MSRTFGPGDLLQLQDAAARAAWAAETARRIAPAGDDSVHWRLLAAARCADKFVAAVAELATFISERQEAR